MDDSVVVHLDHRRLKEFCATTLERVGVSNEHATLVGDTLTRADLRNVHSHGCALLPMYVERIKRGEIAPHAIVTRITENQTIAIIDGGNGLGQVAAVYAMRLAIEKAGNMGSSWIGVRGSNHFGMAAYYALMAIPHDMIGIVLTVSNISTMAPWGGLEVLLGNNPIAIAVPADEEFPVVFDAAFSVAARRKIHDAVAAGAVIPDGWALNRDGNPTTDPREALAGILLPIGGYKGYGLAFMMMLLAGALPGAFIGRAVSNTNVGHLVCAINLAAFGDPTALKKLVDSAVREMHSARKAPGVERILVPGEGGFIAEEERSRCGIPLAPSTLLALERLAYSLGLDPLGANAGY